MTLARRMYGDNMLMKPLGDLLSRTQILEQLTKEPPLPPPDVAKLPFHARLHLLQQVRDLYIAPPQACQLRESIDLGVRRSYLARPPTDPATWKVIGECASAFNPAPAGNTIFLTGHSGSGKTQLALRSLHLYPSQLYVHESFPGLVGSNYQKVWQSTAVPPTGRLVDLAQSLMENWDEVLVRELGSKHRRFASTLSKRIREAMPMVNEWKQVAKAHFLGVLHLDEVQNFFKLPSLQQRRAQRIRGKKSVASADGLELSIAEDACLKYILDLANSGPFALLLSGTLDGVAALTRRFSNAQRFVSSGYHCLDLLEPDSPTSRMFIQRLTQYQYVRDPLPYSSELEQRINAYTAGVRRLIIALWICAHRVAFERGEERNEDNLLLSDLDYAAATYLAPVKPAVQALLSRNPERLREYEDLIPKDQVFWAGLHMI